MASHGTALVPMYTLGMPAARAGLKEERLGTCEEKEGEEENKMEVYARHSLEVADLNNETL